MAAKDLMFKIAILDETKDSLTTIKNNLSGLQRYAQGVQQSVQSAVNSLSNIGKNVDIKLPNMDKFVEQINSLQSVMGKTDAFGVKSLKTALTDFDKVLKSMGDGSAMGNAMRKSVKSMLDAIPDMGTASESSLATFRDRYTRILGGITEEWKKVSTEINKNGGMNLFPKDNQAVLQEHVKSLQNAYKNLSAQSSDFLGAMNRAIAPTNFLQSIIDKVNELVQAIGNARNSLAGKGLLDPVVSKDNENIENISAKLKSLQEMLNTFGNGSYPNIMQGFLGAVSEAFDKVDKVVAERSQKALNMSVYTGGGSTEASEAHKANEQAIKGETEAIKAQEAEVARLDELHRKAQERYTAAIQRSDAVNQTSTWDFMGGRLTNTQEAASWVAQWVKKNASNMGDFYHVDEDKMKQLIAAFDKRYKTIGNAQNVLKGLINEGNGVLAGSAYNTSFGQNNAQIKINEEALKAYKKEVKDAAKEEKDAEAAVDAAYKNLMASKGKLNQMQKEAANSSQQSTSATDKETEAYKQQEQEVNRLTEALEKLKSQRSNANNLLAKAYLNSYNSLTNKWDNPREVQEWMMSYVKRFTKPDANGTYHLDDYLFTNMLQKMGDRYLFRGGVDTKAYSQLFGTNGLFANSEYSLSREPEKGFSATITPDLEAIKAYKKEKQDAAQVVKQADAEITEAEQKLANAQTKLTQATTQQAAAQEKLNSTQQKATQPKQTEINFSEQAKSEAAKMVTPFEEVEKRINDIISRISSSVSTGLDTAFSKNLDSSALVTSLKGFIDNLNKLDESLQQMNKLAEVTTAAQTLLMHAKENLQSASKGGKTVTPTGTTEDAEGGTDPRTYAKNINLLTNAILNLDKAYMSVAESRNKLAKAGRDTSRADKFLQRINDYKTKLGELRTDQNVISQKGLLLGNEEDAKKWAKELDEPIEKIKQLMKLVRDLGNATPMGETYQKLMSGANMFRMDARDADVAARLRDTSRSNLERRDIMSRALADIPVVDLKVARNRFSKVSADQTMEAMHISGLSKSIRDIAQFKDKMDALSESELNQKGKVANLQAEYNKLTSIYRKHLSQYNQLLSAYDRQNTRGAVSDIHSVDLATRKYAELTNKVAEYKQTVDAAQDMKLTGTQAQDLQAFENYIRELETTIKRLQQIMQSGGVDISGANAKQVLNGDFAASAINASKFNKEFKREVRENSKEYQDASKRVESALTKIATLRASLVSAEKGSMVNGKDIVSIANLKDLFNQLLELKNKLSNPDKITAASYLTKDYDLLIQKINEAIKLQNQAVNYKPKVDSKLDPLEQFINEYQKTLSRGTGLGIDQSSLDNLNGYIQRLQALRDEIINLSGKDYLDTNRMQGLIESYNQLKTAAKSAASEVEKLSAKQESLNNKQQKADDRKAQQDIDKRLNSWDKAVEKVETYRNKLKDAEKTLADAKDANSRLGKNIDITDLEAYVQRLRQVVTLLDEIKASGSRIGTTKNGQFFGDVVNSTFRGEVKAGDYNRREVSQQVTAALNEEKKATRENEQAKRQSAQASEQLAKSENSVAQAIANSTNSARNQSQVLSDLKSMATQYLSVWGAQQFISDMTNITGELELQERSLEVILGNASAAREMYSQIRDLSQMSPYTFEDLLKSHRQLAAFGIEAKDIFGTLKSLSDIGAGLDVDVSRLILAYGHTKSYGYLSGIQNRQFETAGIDLVGALTQHYNKLAEAEKQAGKSAEFVTRADIFKRMRTRDIPFEDVQSVIMDLDKPGGKFYNMQIKQYDTLGGKLRNLRNNYRIMQSEIGQANHGILSGFVDMLNDVTENWQRFSRILKGVAFGYAAIKLAALAAGEGVISANKRIFTMGLANGQQKAATNWLNQSHNALGMTPLGIGRGSRALWKTAFSGTSRNRLDVGDQEYLNVKNSKEINNLTKQRIALTGQLTTKAREDLLVEAGINKVRANQIANFGSWRRGIMSIRLGFIGAAQAAKAFIVSVATNPMTWIFAIIGGLTAISSKFSQMDELAETIGNNLADAAKTNIDGIKEILSEYDGLFTENQQPALTSRGTDGSKAELHYVNLDEAELEGRNLTELFNDLRKQLESQSPIYDKDYFNIMKAKDQKKQIEEEFNTLKRLQYVNEVVQQSSGNIEGALKSGSGIFRGEDFATNAGDYEKQYQALKNSFTLDDATWSRLTSDQQKHIRQYMRALGTTRQDAAAMYMKNNPNDERMQQALGASNSNWIWNLSAYKNDVGADTKDVKALGNTIANTIMASFVDAKGNLDAQGAEEYFGQIVNQIMADAKVGTPEIIAELSDNIVEATVAALRGQGKVKQADEFEAAHWENTIGAVVNSQLGNSVTRGMSTKDAYKMAGKTIHDIINRFMVQSPDFKKWWKRIANTAQGADVRKYWEDSAKHLADSALNAASWQLRMKRKYHLSINFDTDVDYSDYIAKLRKAYKEAVEKVNSLSKNRIKWALHIDVLPDLNFKDTKAIKSFRNLIMAQSKIDAAKNKALLKKYGTLNMFKYSAEDRKAAEDANERLEMDKYLMKIVSEEMLPNANALEGEHLQFTDPNKDKKSRKKSNGEDKADREEERRLSARLKLIQDAYNMYKDYYDLYGKDRALREVRRNFKDLRPSDFANLSSLDGLISLYNDFINEVKGTKWKRPKEMKDRANNLISEAITDRQRAELNRDKDAMDKWASNESLWLDRLTKQWDLYDKVRKATGNRDLAVRLSGFNGEEFTNQADALKNHIASEITSFNLKDADGAALGINFSDVLGMSDEQIEDKVKNLFGNNEKYSVQIKAIVADLKKWRDLQQQINDDGAETYATLIGSVESYGNTIKKLNEDLQETIDKLQTARNNGVISQSDYERGVEVKTAQTDLKKYEATAAAQLYMGAAVNNMTRSQANKVYNAYINELNNAFKKGAISAKDYADKVKKVNEQYGKINTTTSDTSAMITGGLDGLLSNRQQKAQAMIDQGAQDYEKYQSAFEEANKVGDYKGMMEAQGGMDKAEAMSKTGSEMMKGAGQAAATVAIIDKIVKTINANMQSLKALFDDIANSIDALGGDAEKFKSSNGYAFVSGFASASQGATDAWNSLKSGNMMGVLEGGYRSIMSFPEAFARAHDARRQRKIDKLSDDVSKIEGYTETIAKAQERTLGYDYGDVIRDYQKQYAANQASIRTIWGKTLTYNKEGAAGTAMAQYYGAAGADTDISGYQQQYNMLIAKRKDYINMYNLENDKKKKNKQSLEEYKEKIADLDDQIKYFGQDLAKNLWSIDIKSWADQISDGLVTAFENGEDAGKAFKDSVRSIMQSVVGNIMKLSIIEPMFKPLQDSLDSLMTNGMKKGTSINDLGRQASALASDFLSQNANAIITASTEFLNGAELGLNNAGLTLLNDSSSTLSSGISSASEDSVNALAGQLAAMRQDVSVIRLQDTMFYNEAWPDYVKNMTSGVSYLQNIDSNVLAIRNLMSENGALYEQVRTLRDDLHSIVTQQKHIKID